MLLSLVTDVRNALVNTLVNAIDDDGYLVVTDDAGVPLIRYDWIGPMADVAVNAVATIYDPTETVVAATGTGTAFYGKIYTVNDVLIGTGNVGTANTFVILNTVDIITGQAVTFISGSFIAGNV
jgi:hypothetical protein